MGIAPIDIIKELQFIRRIMSFQLFTLQGEQGSQHLCRHLLCWHLKSHSPVHGGHEAAQLILQLKNE